MIDQAIPPAVSETADELLEIAKDAIEGVRDWASDTAERARDAVTPPKKKKRSKLPLLLVLLGLGALAFYILRKRGEAADTLDRRRLRCRRRRGPRRQQRRARPAVDTRHLTRTRPGNRLERRRVAAPFLIAHSRRRRESNPCERFCRPLPEPLGYAARADQRTLRPDQRERR